MTKVEKLERTVSSYIKKWLGLPRCLSNIGLYGHNALELPVSSLTEEFKCTKVRLNMTLTESQDDAIREGVAAPRLVTGRKWIQSDTASKICTQAWRHCRTGTARERGVWTCDKSTHMAQGNINPEKKAGGCSGAAT